MTDFDLAVIGSGPGGYVAAIRAAQLGLKTCCIEESSYLGGTCLNVGCIPSKSLLHASSLFTLFSNGAKGFGIHADNICFSLQEMMQDKDKTIESFRSGIMGLFKKNKVTSFFGKATIKGPHEVFIEGGKTIVTKQILLATGSKPIELPFAPFDEKNILSSSGALSLKEVPRELVVIGAGVIGCEIGSIYKRLGSSVHFIEFLPNICAGMDITLRSKLMQTLESQGMSFDLSCKVTAIKKEQDTLVVSYQKEGKTEERRATHVLVCIGRKPRVSGLGLENVGIVPDAQGLIPVNRSFQTEQKTIFAIGDLIDGPMLAHKASEEGTAAAEIIAGHTPKLDYMSIAGIVYTSPEAASVGLSEQEAKALNRPILIGQFPFMANSRARCTHETAGFVKVIVDEISGKLLGAHILSAHASELIAECALAIKHRLKAEEIASTCHAHPTLSEAIKEACLAAYGKAIHF
jgi:dihydrolipoamide dehydrogenase